MSGNPLIHFYRTPAFSPAKTDEILSLAGTHLSPGIIAVETEYCFYIETTSPLTSDESGILRWLLSETFEQEKFGENSFLNPPIPPLPRGGVRGGNHSGCRCHGEE